MAQLDPEIDHLLRRAGFGVSAADVDTFSRHVARRRGRAISSTTRAGPTTSMRASAGPTTRRSLTKDLFAPDIDIDDARQRWLFRMIHTRRPLQEKMALFWHNHFATAYSKLAADSGAMQAAKMLAHKPGALRGPQGQIELFRQYALGNFRDLLRAGGAGSRDAGVARRQEQHHGEAAGELRPRDHGAVHGRRRPLHRAGRLCRRARVHRLEPAGVRRRTADDTTT